MARGAVRQRQGRPSCVADTARGSVAAAQRHTMAECACIGHVSSGLVAGRVGIIRAPGFRVRGVGDMAATTLTPAAKASYGHIEPRVVPR